MTLPEPYKRVNVLVRYRSTNIKWKLAYRDFKGIWRNDYKAYPIPEEKILNWEEVVE